MLAFRRIKPGDFLTLLAGGLGTIWLMLMLWSGGAADKAIIRAGGKIFREASLLHDQKIEVPGPLGVSIVTIKQHKARISSDPGPRQYCVHQGWLQQTGEIAVCLPNQVSVELTGGKKRNYDSLNY